MKFQRTTVRARLELASGAFVLIMLLLAIGGWWSLRSLSASADRALATAFARQSLSLRLVSSTMRAMQAGTGYVSRPSPRLRDEFERLAGDAHAVAAKLNRDSLASADEAELIAHLDRQLSLLETALTRAHVHVDIGERAAAMARLDETAPMEAAVLKDVERLGVADAEHVAAVTSTLRRNADSRMLALVLAIVLTAVLFIIVARWVSHTVSRPLSQLLTHAVELGHQNTSVRTPPDSVPDEFRPLAVAMNEAAIMSGELQAEVLLRRRAEAAAREARHRADAANRAKSDFLARMSHELRTPLNSVIGFAGVLMKNKTGNLQVGDLEFLARIKTNGRHLLQLIDSVLDLSKIESGRMTATREAVALDALIRETLDEIEGRMLDADSQSTPARVILRADLPSPMAVVSTDRMKLKQMIINLTANALTFTERGVVTVSVVTDAATGTPLRIDITDTGPGIPADRQAAIFEPFEQATAETGARFGGTGLGLPITRAFADLLGYRVTIESTVGQGSVFSICLEPQGSSAMDHPRIEAPTSAGVPTEHSCVA